MPNNNEIEQLLFKYFRNECSKRELLIIHDWLTNPDHKEHFDRVLDQFIQNEDQSIPTHLSRINSWEIISNTIAAEENHERDLSNRPGNKHISLIAVIVVLLMMASFAIINLDRTFKGPPEPQEQLISIFKETERGQKKTVRLPDGSRVTLNSSSALEISPDFNNGNRRIVYLKGEAFFQVEKMPHKPFIVKTHQITTKVLGTSFNVDAYQPDKIKIAVRTGKVQVSGDELSMDLVPDEMAIYNEKEGILKTKFDSMQEFGWKDGYLVFNEADFKTLVNKLEQWYGVNIAIIGDMPKKDTFTAKYNRVSLENVLKGLSFSGNFKYRLNDKNVIIEFN